MIEAHIFSNVERRAPHPRAGHAGDLFELLLLCLRYDAERFDVQAVARNKRSGERWSRLFQQEPDDRQVTRAVDWLLELVGAEGSSAILQPIEPRQLFDERWTAPFAPCIDPGLSEQVSAALAAAAAEDS